MGRFTIDLPDELRTKLAERAVRTGHANVEEFVVAVLWTEAEGEDWGAPPGVSFSTRAELEAILGPRLAGADAGSDVTPDPAFWAGLRKRAAGVTGDSDAAR